jgi:hypothetical protein
MSAVLVSVALLLGVVLQLVFLVYFGEDTCWSIGMIAVGPFSIPRVILRMGFLSALGSPDARTAFGKILEASAKVLILAAAFTFSPLWITASFLIARQWLGRAVTVTAIGLLLAGIVSLWLRARRLERLSRNPLSGLQRFLRAGWTDTEPKEMVPLKLTATATNESKSQ